MLGIGSGFFWNQLNTLYVREGAWNDYIHKKTCRLCQVRNRSEAWNTRWLAPPR
jgi:hypothetical protein